MTDGGSVDRRLVALAAVLTVLSKIGLRVTSLATVRRVATGVAGFGTAASASTEPERIGVAVAAVGRRLPGSTCLTTAVAADALLTAAGHDAELLLGVKRTGERMRAHAWVEVDGRPIVGDDVDLSSYDRLTDRGATQT